MGGGAIYLPPLFHKRQYPLAAATIVWKLMAMTCEAAVRALASWA